VVVSQHPVTTEYGAGIDQIIETLTAVRDVDIPAIVLWPNADAGADDIARGIRGWRERGLARKMHFFKNLPIDIYVWLLQRAKCLVGNSSSGIREGGFIGVPVVNIGSRQTGRERGHNVIDAPHDAKTIAACINKQLRNGRYPADLTYGDGNAGTRIANILANASVKIQKRITF
jgi:UDP-N-acetylglucosamine 2-epimerase